MHAMRDYKSLHVAIMLCAT